MKKQVTSKETSNLLPAEFIERKIYYIRGHKVLFGSDLSKLYGVETKALVQAVKRNKSRFPIDFMFQLNRQELEIWRSRIVTSNPSAKMALRYQPYVFTEQGVAMLSSVLRSNKAVEVNIAIMRVFVHIRELMISNKEVARRIDELESKYDKNFRTIFEAIRQLVTPEVKLNKNKMGFETD